MRGGAGLVGWHGGLCDAFRHMPAYQFMTGGQWLAHPGGSHATYTIDIAPDAAGDPVMAGLSSFSITSEQYYLAVDPAVEILATTRSGGRPRHPGSRKRSSPRSGARAGTAAGSYQWPAIGSLLGGRFNGHPITGDLPITVIDRSHPATAHLPSPWRFRDELYLFRELVPDARLLLAVEFGGSDVGILPIAWCIERAPVRTFYTVLGHFVAAYEDAHYLQHLLGGIRWVLAGQSMAAADSAS